MAVFIFHAMEKTGPLEAPDKVNFSGIDGPELSSRWTKKKSSWAAIERKQKSVNRQKNAGDRAQSKDREAGKEARWANWAIAWHIDPLLDKDRLA